MKIREITCSTEPTNEPCDRCKYKYHPAYSSPCAECGADFPKKFEPMEDIMKGYDNNLKTCMDGDGNLKELISN